MGTELDKLKPLDVESRLAKLRELCFTEQRKVLPKYGFTADHDGVAAMTDAFQIFSLEDDEIQGKTQETQRMLYLGCGLASMPSKSQTSHAPLKLPINKSITDTSLGPSVSGSLAGGRTPGSPRRPGSSGGRTPKSPEGGSSQSPDAFLPLADKPQPKSPKSNIRKWRVIGGENKGGIIVREGSSTTSLQLGRIEHGAVLEGLELLGDRMRYQKVVGHGPNTGWVSMMFRGVDLVAPVGSHDMR